MASKLFVTHLNAIVLMNPIQSRCLRYSLFICTGALRAAAFNMLECSKWIILLIAL